MGTAFLVSNFSGTPLILGTALSMKKTVVLVFQSRPIINQFASLCADIIYIYCIYTNLPLNTITFWVSTVAEELVGMRHAFRCKKVDEFIPAINTQQPFTIPEWLTWTLSVVAVLLTVTVATLYMTHKKNSCVIKVSEFIIRLVVAHRRLPNEFLVSRHDQLFGMSSPTPERNVTEKEMERDPLYNPDWQNEDEMIQPFTMDVRPNEERPLMERVNHVQAQPMNDPFGSNLGENLNPSAHRLLSDEPSHSEGSANNDVLTGVNEGVTVELSNYRNGKPI